MITLEQIKKEIEDPSIIEEYLENMEVSFLDELGKKVYYLVNKYPELNLKNICYITGRKEKDVLEAYSSID